jgi:hypothetical protein
MSLLNFIDAMSWSEFALFFVVFLCVSLLTIHAFFFAFRMLLK